MCITLIGGVKVVRHTPLTLMWGGCTIRVMKAGNSKLLIKKTLRDIAPASFRGVF